MNNIRLLALFPNSGRIVSKPFDASLKYLIERFPEDWAQLIGIRQGPVEVVEADLSTVTAEADKVLRIGSAEPWHAHLELQASYDADLPNRVLRYNVLLNARLGTPVHSTVVLLRKEADGRRMTGRVEIAIPGNAPHLTFTYDVVRAWELPVENLLNAGLGVLPLAPIAETRKEALPGVVRRMEQRLDHQPEAGTLWTAASVLMGLRYEEAFIDRLLAGVRNMKESVTYQAIIREGVIKGEESGARDMFITMASARLGAPSAEIVERLENIHDPNALKNLGIRALKVESWAELFGE